MANLPLPGRGRSKKKQPKRTPATPRILFVRRLSLITVCFCAVCVLYCTLLIVFGSKGNAFSIYRGDQAPAGSTTKTVTIQAVRGEIYDRNGKPLVTNRSCYDVVLDHDPLMTTTGADKRNRALLSTVALLRSPEDGALSEEFFPLTGTYPELSYRDEAKDPSTAIGNHLKLLLARIDLPATSSPASLAAYFVDKYALSATVDGIPAYTDDQITTLIRIYYDMERCRFGTDTAEYTLLTDASASVLAAALEMNAPGLRVQMRTERIYHYPGYASHILGRVNQIFAEDWEYYSAQGYPMNAIVGVSGCESAFETVLRGTDGQMSVTVDSTGKTLSSTVTKEAIAGRDIRLTIDISLQIAAEDALRAAVGQNGKGAVVLTDPNTGAYLALASAPSYDLSTFSEDYPDLAADARSPLLNRALQQPYAPGKLLSLSAGAAGLNTGLLTPLTLWQDDGVLQYTGGALLCPKLYTSDTGHGKLNLSTALVDGCDVFFGLLGQALGSTAIARFEESFGLGQKTGIELSEATGNLSSLSGESALIQAALGTAGAKMTPAQLNVYLSVIVTEGTRYQAYLLQEVRDYVSGEIVTSTRPSIASQVTLNAASCYVLPAALRDIAAKESTLAAISTGLNDRGIEFGAFLTEGQSATHGEQGNGLLVAYARPLSASSAAGTVALTVVIENSTASACSPVATRILETVYGLE